MPQRLCIYATSPTDHWDGMVPADQWLRAAGPPSLMEGRVQLWGQAEAAVRRHPLWEDALRREGPWPRVGGVPDGEGETHVIFAWKLDNNGTTMVVTPVRLPWLDDAESLVLPVDDQLRSEGAALLMTRW